MTGEIHEVNGDRSTAVAMTCQRFLAIGIKTDSCQPFGARRTKGMKIHPKSVFIVDKSKSGTN